MDHVVYVKNRIPNRSIKCSPYERLTGSKPSLKYIRVFGCAAFFYEHNPKSKVHARATAGIMLGCNDHGVYTIECLIDSKIINFVHVSFDELSFLNWNILTLAAAERVHYILRVLQLTWKVKNL